ncbi:MAG: hypothetical protein C0594_10700 [Marinilabiliales bacterium]|nr:MAG: hypothetical protein C0594_10700 [Marinilabiliales bacterium]
MKKLIVISSLFILFLSNGFAQQLPMYSQYMYNGFLLNPAIAGTEEFSPLRLTARQQWANIQGAPLTVALSYHTLLTGNKMGIGGFIMRDQFGPVARTGLLAAYSYQLEMPAINSKLSFGLSGMAFQYELDENKLKLESNNDPLISGAKQTAIVPDANFGMYLYSPRYFVGVAATNLIEMKMNLGEYANAETKMVRHYFATVGYQFVLSDEVELEPSVLFKATERSPFNIDINAKVIYKKSYWLGISYRTDNDIVAMIGLKKERFSLGYAFDYGLNAIQDYTYGSHEVIIGVDLGGQEVGSSLL